MGVWEMTVLATALRITTCDAWVSVTGLCCCCGDWLTAVVCTQQSLELCTVQQSLTKLQPGRYWSRDHCVAVASAVHCPAEMSPGLHGGLTTHAASLHVSAFRCLLYSWPHTSVTVQSIERIAILSCFVPSLWCVSWKSAAMSVGIITLSLVAGMASYIVYSFVNS